VFSRAGRHDRAARLVLDKAGHLLLNVSVRRLTTGESTSLNIPDALHDHWQEAGTCPVPKPS
jgi:hypothetical protein